MNTKRYTLSLSLALALGVSTVAQASQANHESEWSNVISYGNTTIAHDSPNDFGPWMMMVQPAAGPTGAQSPSAVTTQPLTQFSDPIPKPTLKPRLQAATPPVTALSISFAGTTATGVVAPPAPPAVTPPPPPPTPTGLPASRTRTR